MAVRVVFCPRRGYRMRISHSLSVKRQKYFREVVYICRLLNSFFFLFNVEMQKILERSTIYIYGDGLKVRTFSY